MESERSKGPEDRPSEEYEDPASMGCGARNPTGARVPFFFVSVSALEGGERWGKPGEVGALAHFLGGFTAWELRFGGFGIPELK